MIREKPHKKLVLWKKSIELVQLIYEITKSYPRDEEFGLKSQMRRAAVSVPSNISEGLSRATRKDKLHFLNIAQSSLAELDAQLEISERLTLLKSDETDRTAELQTEVESLLSGLIRSMK
jgi:four helix bundle protein